jgi:hypothetical protein
LRLFLFQNVEINYAKVNTKKRLQEFVKYKGTGRNNFEKVIGISSGYLSSESPSVGSEIIRKIVHHYPDLNIEWLITGNGKMLKTPYWEETGTDRDIRYKKLIYVPLVSRYSQAEYIHRLNDKLYINTLPTLPVMVENESKGTYMCFEMWNDSMNDGSDNSYNPGDILVCREIDNIERQKRLYFGKPKPFVIIHKKDGVTVRQITNHDIEKGAITVHSPNPLYGDSPIHLQEVKKLFNVFQLQRIMN